MTLRASAVCAATLAIFIPFPVSAAESTRTPFDVATFDRFMEGHLRDTGIPGMSVAITDQSSILMIKGYGRDGAGARMTEHTPMFIGSLSKSVTAVAVMLLVEKGRIDLERSVSDYLPQFRLADARYRRITVRQLLNQTSGMSDSNYYEWSLPSPRSLSEALEALQSARLAADPGNQFNYHNRNYDVAAHLVETVSGERFDQYLRKNIFEPLGMHDAHVVARIDDAEGKVPRGHVFAFGRAIPLAAPPFFLAGSGGVVASASDMGQWLLFHSRGGATASGVRLLTEASMQLMHRASATDGSYGFGWVDRSTVTPSSVLHAGWTPTFTAFQSLSLDGRHNIAILSNGGRTFMNGSSAPYVHLAVEAIASGDAPQSFGTSTRDLDIALAIAALLVLSVAIRAALRARSWTETALNQPRWITIAQLASVAAVLAFVISIPKLGGDAMGGRVTAWSIVGEPSAWIWLFYVSPVGLLFCASVAAGCVAVLSARVNHLVRIAL